MSTGAETLAKQVEVKQTQSNLLESDLRAVYELSATILEEATGLMERFHGPSIHEEGGDAKPVEQGFWKKNNDVVSSAHRNLVEIREILGKIE